MKRLRGIALLLTAGAVLNVLVAWGIAIVVDSELLPPRNNVLVRFGPKLVKPFDAEDFDNVYQRYSTHRLGKSEVSFSPVTWNHFILSYGQQPDFIVTAADADCPSWTRDPARVKTRFKEPEFFYFTACGWPFKSLSNEATYSFEDNPSFSPFDWRALSDYRWCLIVERLTWTFRLPRVLPLRPVWSGVIANSVLYAALLSLPILLRRRIRRRRGNCPTCAYDLRGDLLGGCPECGWNRAGARN